MRRERLPILIRSARIILALGSALLLTEPAAAQQQPGSLLPNPRLSFVTPGGARAGSTVEVTFTGTDLEEPKELLFSHPDIKATPVVLPTPPQPKPDPKKPPVKPAPPPPITKFKVTVGPKVPVGIYDARLVGEWGVSNARAFVVGDLAEVAEKEPNDDVDKAQRVEINSTISGVISAPTDVDYYVFTGKKGERVVVSCLASSIDSRLDPDLRLFDAKGKQLAANRGYHGKDALVDATLPADGDYQVRVCQFTYTEGSPEHFYRLSITTAPWIDAVHPPMIEPGKTAKVTVYGRNLPGGQRDESAVVDGRVLEKVTVEIKAPADKAALGRLAYTGLRPINMLSVDGFEHRIKNDSGTSNSFLITYAQAPVVLDNEANDTEETAQEVTVPCEIAGRVEKRRDRDWYVFKAKKGDVYNIEVFSDRLGAPTDMYFLLRNPATKQEIVEVDPNNEILNFNFKFYMTTDDPGVYTFTAPADGKYQLLVASRTADTLAGPRHFYRVRITAPQPDFHVAIMAPDNFRPDSGLLYQAGNAYYTAFVWRHDGFAGDVTLTAEGLPKGVTCPPQTLGAGTRSAKIVLIAAADAPAWAGTIRFKATATIKGQVVEREVRPAGIVWTIPPQQNIPALTRLEHDLALAVRSKAPYTLKLGLDKATVEQGGKVTVPIKLERHWPDFKGAVQTVPNPLEIPNTVLNLPPVNVNGDTNVVLNISSSAPPGIYNIVLRGAAPVPFNKDPMNKARPPVNVVQVSTPLALTILPKQLANVSVSNSNPTVKIGQQVEVVVQVSRQFNYEGEFKVLLVLPPNDPALSAAEVTIPAGQNEAKLVIKAAATAVAANRPNLSLKVTALYNGNVPITKEVKINVNVVK
jgi:hypothetical protein